MKTRLIILIILVITMSIYADGVQPEGMGTEAEPYLVDSLDNLLWLSTNPEGWESYYLQTSDIDASETVSWNEGAGFSPIGWWISSMDNEPFRGSYNGYFLKITGLFINRPEQDGCGLFGYAQSGRLERLRLIDADVTGDDYIGCLAGYLNNETVVDCSAEGQVVGDWSAAMLAGHCKHSYISDCYGKGVVTGGEYSGGLLGNVCFDSEINSCYADADVTAEFRVGGFAGYNYSSEIRDCYAVGAVSGIEKVGGLVGDNDNSVIFNTYASGSVSGESAVGGLAGRNDSEIHCSIWNLESSGQEMGIGNDEGGTAIDLWGKTTLEMQESLTYTDLGWDFEDETANGEEDIWNIGEDMNSGFAYLADLGWTVSEEDYYAWFVGSSLEVFVGEEIEFIDLSAGAIESWEWDFDNDGIIDSGEERPVWNYSESGIYDVSLTISGSGGESDSVTRESYICVIFGGNIPAGSGTEADPFQIETLDNLYWLSSHFEYWDCYFIQTGDIDASDTVNWNEGAGFSPIGNYDQGSFSGRYNGDDHIIDGLYINRPEVNQVGMFGYSNCGIVENLGLINVDITGSWGVGSIMGQFYSDSELNNCYATGSIAGEVEIGGLFGHGFLQEYQNSHYNYDEILINGEHHYSYGVLPTELYNAWLANEYSLDISDYLEEEEGSYLVSDTEDLETLLVFGGEPEIAFKLTNDLDLGEMTGFYIPYLGADFDGDGHCIANLEVAGLQNSTLGLFGHINGALVRSLGVINAQLTGKYYNGGLAGLTFNTEIRDCYAESYLTGYYSTGGLIGCCAISSEIINCYSSGEVDGENFTGGLIGVIDNDCSVTSSFSSCTVTGVGGVGGFAGINKWAEITNCYALGDVNGSYTTGGFVGVNNNAAIENSYAVGNVNGGENTGGFAGENDDGSSIYHCVWNVESSGQEDGVGLDEGYINDLQGMTSGEMQVLANYLDMGWDFIDEEINGTEDIWDMDSGLNNGYPFITAIGGDVSEDEDMLVSTVNIFAYPNPFNPETIFSFALSKPGNVKLEIFNLKGQKVKTLCDEWKTDLNQKILWQGDDAAGQAVSTGIYFARLVYDGGSFCRKCVLIK
ncbi:MAG: GLUG motif-containing protein [Candidatus Stygibacter australis]|nr:GLUG motif-containing protein [Candidatus Stygibacter australis]